MEGTSSGGGGPAPFLLKTYDMVDDSSTDEIVSWSASKTSFVVWNPPEFARLLLPNYFKHNNFSSFIRQLNTYGFRKIDSEKWEFANEDFVKDQKHLLKNIHRRKPIHSHSHPPNNVDPERAALDEEINQLSHEKDVLEAKLLKLKQQRSTANSHFEELRQQVANMEQRQEKLLTFLEKAVQNPAFVEQLAHKIDSLDISAYNKKRRLPQAENSKTVSGNCVLENSCSSRSEFGNLFDQDFSNKLRLGLSPAISDGNLVSHSIQSSNEDGGSQKTGFSDGDLKDAQTRADGALVAPDALELSDTGSFPRKLPLNENTRVQFLQHRLTSSEEVDGNISCHLNLTLASSSLPAKENPSPNKTPQRANELGKFPEFNFSVEESDGRDSSKNMNMISENRDSSVLREAPKESQKQAATPARVNDIFWEQFLTERPGSSDNEEASSTYRGCPHDEQEDRRSGLLVSRDTKSIEKLTL